MSVTIELIENLPVTETKVEFRGNDFIRETVIPPFPLFATPPIKSSVVTYARHEQFTMYNLLHLFSSPLMLLEFRDHMDDGTDVVITRTDLAKAWLAAVDYIRFHAGLQNWLVKRKKLDYDFQGEDVESIIDDLSMVLDVFRYLFFELDRALALLRQCEAKHYVPLAWYKPSVAYDVRGLYDYPFALKPDTPISRLTPVFIHAAKYALMIAYDRMYREDFETIAYKTGFTWINPCKVHGLTPVKTEGDGIRAYGQDGPPADRPVFSRQCQPHL